MPYDYTTQRPFVFTEEGQAMVLQLRDRAQELLEHSGACSHDALIRDCSGSSWDILACVDRLIELGYLRRLGQEQNHYNAILTSPKWKFRHR